MYIIIKGSVNIKVRKNYESYAKGNYEVVINSFYDGEQLMKKLNRFQMV
jgi:hypothetical protein